MTQVLSLAGALLVLAGFVALQVRWLDVRNFLYQVLNLAGAGILTIAGLLSETWGFVLLNGVWTTVSIFKLFQLARSAGNSARNDIGNATGTLTDGSAGPGPRTEANPLREGSQKK